MTASKHKYYFDPKGGITHAQDEYNDRCGGSMVIRPDVPGYLSCDKCGHQEDAQKLIDRWHACTNCGTCTCGRKK